MSAMVTQIRCNCCQDSGRKECIAGGFCFKYGTTFCQIGILWLMVARYKTEHVSDPGFGVKSRDENLTGIIVVHKAVGPADTQFEAK